MPQFKTEAIVLQRFNFSESSIIVTFFSKDFGKVKCIVKGARKIKSRFGGRFEPFTCLNIIYLGKEHQNLYLLTHCDTIKPFYNLRKDYSRLTVACYFLEIINSFTREAEKNIDLFHLLFRALDVLQRTENISVLARIFEMKTVALSGYTPKFTTCLICKQEPAGKHVNFHFQQGGVICEKCLNGSSPGRKMSLGTLNYLKKTLTINLDSVDRLKFPRGTDKEMGVITHLYIKTIIGREFKSFKFLV